MGSGDNSQFVIFRSGTLRERNSQFPIPLFPHSPLPTPHSPLHDIFTESC
ncbi:MAG: hypothetical protein KME64_41835 [Scytonematopsis contorta HA4267-MV1]|nr:hypothetical protein [Scytonematopsis contorta HA4267-MV1]